MENVIRVLSEQTINQIAAGEVIENPASVIKELVENSLDAKATKITIEILAGGQQLICVTDDGVGMSGDDAILSLERYATSKIKSFDDLSSLQSMGFRGEALASIGSISRLSLVTAKDNQPGTCIEMDGGKMIRVSPCARKQGTTVEVKSLFYNVPARKKFQKSIGANTGEIHRMAIFLSLAHPHIEFTLIQRDEVLLSTGPVQEADFSKALQKRISSVIGEEFHSISHEVSYKENDYEIRGIIGSPEHTRPHRTGQYLFVNRRPVFSPMISHVIREAYGTRITSGRHPIYVIHLELPSHLVDVNVHPQKKEVRFREDVFVRQFLDKAVRFAFGEKNTFPEERAAKEPMAPFVVERQANFEIFQKKQEENYPLLFSYEEKIQEPALFIKPLQILGVFKGHLFVHGSSLQAREVFLGKNLTSDDIVVVDLIAAQESLFFTSLLTPIEEAQQLLLPVKITLSPANGKLVEEHVHIFTDLGITISPISKDVFVVEAAPSMIPLSDLPKMILEIIDQIQVEQNIELEEENQQIHFAAKMSQFAKAQKPPFMLQEAITLLEKLLRCRDPFFTPQGKPTMVCLKSDDIQDIFKSRKNRIL